MKTELRKATLEDLATAHTILTQGRLAQRAAGFHQWEDGYPSTEIIEADIASDNAYMLEVDGHDAGYVVIATYDAEYERLSSIWRAVGAYGVAHRIALADEFRGRGLADVMFHVVENKMKAMGLDAIRIDTGLENRPMQRAMTRRGYNALGAHHFIWGPRLAFDKSLAESHEK